MSINIEPGSANVPEQPDENTNSIPEERDADELVHQETVETGIDVAAADPDDLVHSHVDTEITPIDSEIDPDDLIHEKDPLDEDTI